MFYTRDNFILLLPPPEFLEEFDKNFPEGAEDLDIFSRAGVDKDFLQWFGNKVPLTSTAREAFHGRMGIIDSDYVIRSRTVVRSSHVMNSYNVFSSKGIFNSEHIWTSEDVVNSEDIRASRQIFSSDFVDNSTQVLNSQAIARSLGVVNSNAVRNSNHIHGCSGVRYSSFIATSANVEYCISCDRTTNLKHSMFCTDINGGDYLLFNKPTDEKILQQVVRDREQFGYFAPNMDWPIELRYATLPDIRACALIRYENAPKEFFEWVRTLPNYDPEIATKIFGISM